MFSHSAIRSLVLVLSILPLSFTVGCSGGSSGSPAPAPTPEEITIVVSPSSASILASETQQFTATVTGATNPTITWSVDEGASGGTITSSGLYTAPDASGTFQVRAAVGMKSATALVHVTKTPSTGHFTLGSPMVDVRYQHTATLLQDGRVLIVGGIGIRQNATAVIDTAEVYNPASGTFTAVGSLSTPRYCHTATILPDGKVLVAGGSAGAEPLDSTEIFDPVTNTFSTGKTMLAKRAQHTATVLPDGAVLLAGAYPENASVTAEIYDPRTDTFNATGQMFTNRMNHTATLLSTGAVLFAGGNLGGVNVSNCEIFSPSTGKFYITGALTVSGSRNAHAAVMLSDGRVLAIGGSTGSGTYATTAEVFDIQTETWTPLSAALTGASYQTATLLADNAVLIAGGSNGSKSFKDATLFTVDGEFKVANIMNKARSFHTSTRLKDGKLLVTGGMDVTRSSVLGSTELFF